MKYRPEYNKKLIGENMRKCRQAKQLSVDQVREYLRLGSVQAIYKWEEGRSFPQTDTMFALMELYEIGLQELLCDAEQRSEIKMLCDAGPVMWQLPPETENGRWMRRMLTYFKSFKRILGSSGEAWKAKTESFDCASLSV